MAFSTPREKSVRFGRLANQSKKNKQVENSIEGYVKDLIDCYIAINVSLIPCATGFERWKRACTNSVLLCLFKILMSVRRSQVDVEWEPAGTTEAGLVVVVQEDIDIVDRHVPVRDALRFCLSYTLPLMHCFLQQLTWTMFWTKSPFDDLAVALCRH